ncbi:hypothetical protein LAZ29_03210 [Cereibacter sphaeroides]|uniref:hypothetical protein n=1 Tax=Cereibacter sphaeroides TaxID=1063 RepID=UPI001F42E8B8|nr:hypothetical protein [Cereibacter sphaeroides]MCE6949933.1 hypothetical protein [Cereibacter sphaeroides]
MATNPDRFLSHAAPPEEGGFWRRFETHHKPKGRPLLWTFETRDAEDEYLTHVWLQNGLEQTLDRVIIRNAAMITVDDVASGSASGALIYEVVLPGEAVRLDTRNIMYDSDYMLSTDILVERQGEPPLKLRLGPAKGGDGGVLLRAPLAEEHDKNSVG